MIGRYEFGFFRKCVENGVDPYKAGALCKVAQQAARVGDLVRVAGGDPSVEHYVRRGDLADYDINGLGEDAGRAFFDRERKKWNAYRGTGSTEGALAAVGKDRVAPKAAPAPSAPVAAAPSSPSPAPKADPRLAAVNATGHTITQQHLDAWDRMTDAQRMAYIDNHGGSGNAAVWKAFSTPEQVEGLRKARMYAGYRQRTGSYHPDDPERGASMYTSVDGRRASPAADTMTPEQYTGYRQRTNALHPTDPMRGSSMRTVAADKPATVRRRS